MDADLEASRVYLFGDCFEPLHPVGIVPRVDFIRALRLGPVTDEDQDVAEIQFLGDSDHLINILLGHVDEQVARAGSR